MSQQTSAAERTEDLTGAERRVWVRYPSALPVACVPAKPPEPARLPARVVNISRGGLSLAVSRPLQEGAVFGLELPGMADRPAATVLACVLRVQPPTAGEWVLGCSFAAELSDEDLEAFGLHPDATHADRRTRVRFPGRTRAVFEVVGEPGAWPRPARVVDISTNGIGLAVDRPIEVGALLSLQLAGAAGEPPLSLLACPARVVAQEAGEWLWGCTFQWELSDEELQTLL